MSLFDMYYRDTIQSPAQQMSASGTVNEFDNLGARISAWALREHNEDGTHNLRPSGFDFVPIGSMVMWPAATAPSGWLLCDGSQVSRTTYVTLFTLMGTTYGAGDGTTTFNLPDLRQRFPLGKAAAGTGSVLGSTGGAIDHTHTGGTLSGSTGATAVTISGSTATGSTGTGTTGTGSTGTGTTGDESGHTHPVNIDTGNQINSVSVTVDNGVAVAGVSVVHHHNVNGNTGAGTTHNHSVPSLSVPGLSVPSLSIPALGVGSLAGASHSHPAGTLAVGASGTANPPYISINFIISAGV